MDDVLLLEKLFVEEKNSFIINCKNIYAFHGAFIDLLYKHQHILQKNIRLLTNRARLSKYIHNIGFRCLFEAEEKQTKVRNVDIDILAIGGSAYSSKKIIELLSSIDTTKFTIFIIQHISSKKENKFDLLLSQYVKSRVVYAKDGMDIEKGFIYLADKEKHMLVSQGKIVLSDSEKVNDAKPSISVSVASLSNEYKDNLLTLLTCGYRDDGVDSLSLLRKNASTIIIETPQECKADIIPKEALSHRVYDFVLNLEDIATYINIMHKKYISDINCLEYLLEVIYKKYEYDFRFYFRESIHRRVTNFMVKYEITNMKTLFIQVLFNPTIFHLLFLDLSINVTEFFRKRRSSEKMIKLMKNDYKNCYNVKVWSAGCSNGSEVYSTAIILSELGLLDKSIIYATDINPVVIEEAKNAFYNLNVYEKAKLTYQEFGFNGELSRYFDINDMYIRVKEKLREKVLFFVHNLEKDSVFNEFDIIECKNVIIYFDEVLQEKVFKTFYDSLKFGGYLFLGESEEPPLAYKDNFEKCNENCKVYRKVA